MKVKNIMFSGFAAAILMGVGAANAVVSDATYNLANTGYVDAKVAAVAGQKEAVANKMNATTAGATDLDVLAADEANYPSVAAAVEIADKKAKAVVKDVNEAAGDLATLKGNVDKLMVKVDTEGNVAAAIAGALTEAKGYADGLANNYDAKGTAAGLIAGLDLANTYDAKGAAAAAETAAKAYADGLADNYDAKGTAEGLVNALNIAQYAKTADLKADSVGATGSFIATISETNGIISASATEFAEEVTADGAIAPTAKAVNDFVTGKGYAVASEVNTALAKKLQLTEGLSAGTYMVTVGEGGVVTYTAVTVATAADAAN